MVAQQIDARIPVEPIVTEEEASAAIRFVAWVQAGYDASARKNPRLTVLPQHSGRRQPRRVVMTAIRQQLAGTPFSGRMVKALLSIRADHASVLKGQVQAEQPTPIRPDVATPPETRKNVRVQVTSTPDTTPKPPQSIDPLDIRDEDGLPVYMRVPPIPTTPGDWMLVGPSWRRERGTAR